MRDFVIATSAIHPHTLIHTLRGFPLPLLTGKFFFLDVVNAPALHNLLKVVLCANTFVPQSDQR